MIQTNIHGVTEVELTAVKQNYDGADAYFTQQLTIATERSGLTVIDLYADTAEALMSIADTDRWRTKADEESARADAAESLADEWRNKHATLYLRAEKDQQRAESAERRLAALQELLYKACDASGERVGGVVQP